jgi:tetratricopeptide (TPR) repeat protein
MNSMLTEKIIRFTEFILIIVLVCSIPIYSQTEVFDSLINVGINQIYNIKFEEAEATFANLDRDYSKQPAGKFFKAMIIWWKINLDQSNEQYDDLFEEKLEDVIDFCDDLLDEDDENVDAIFFKGGALGFRGRLSSIRKEWFDAALDGKDALPLVYEAFKIDSTNEDVKLGFGIYNYYAEAIPEKYPFIKPAMIFFPSGDKEKGIRQLKSASINAKYAAIESQYFLMNLYYQFENDYNKALEYAAVLHDKFPDNPIFQKYVGRVFVKKGNYNKAAMIFEDVKKKSELNMPGYSETLLRESTYYLGVNHMRKNQIDSAESSFSQCVELSRRLDEENDEESGFQVNAVLYLGKIYSQRGEAELAKKYYNHVLEMRDYSNSHKKAERFLVKLK